MADLTDPRPLPPGEYPATVVGSGPGGLQIAYLLGRLRIGYAHISSDPEPGGMFRRLPVFDRLLSWSKPAPPPGPGIRGAAWYDWNLLLAGEDHRVRVSELMSSPGLFPSRQEMQQALAVFAQRARLPVRFECRWIGTRRLDQGLVIETTDGEYRSPLVILATGMALPWRPPTPGIEYAVDYSDVGEPGRYSNRRVLVLGKQNSGFELADALLPFASQLIVAGPGPTRFTITTGSIAGSRVRFDQVYEDHVVGGGSAVLDAVVASIERDGDDLLVDLRVGGSGRPLVVAVDDVLSAAGFTSELGDLRQLGVKTVSRDRLPALTPFWESTTVPGIYFAGTLTQGAPGLRKGGVPSTSASIQGFRYNAAVLASHLAERHFGVARPERAVGRDQLVDLLLGAASRSAGLMSQKGYLARVIEQSEGDLFDRGLQPLAAFLEGDRPAIALTLEGAEQGLLHPVLYHRLPQGVSEHILDPQPMHNFENEDHRRQLRALLTDWLQAGL